MAIFTSSRRAPIRVVACAAAGASAHVLRGSGAAIDDKFPGDPDDLQLRLGAQLLFRA